MTSTTIDPAAALALLHERETAAYKVLNAARAAHDAVIKHVFALKLAALTARVPGFISVVIDSDDQGGMFMSVSATVILDEAVNDAAVNAPGADLDPDTGLLNVDEAEEQIRELVDEYGTGLLEIWDDDTISDAALPGLVAEALTFATTVSQSAAAGG
ncbi:MAG TPA: hypothetical protein VGO80_06570 [Solirubrobacteraceae bacterium]|jgi:hypothetical protein|nr:hypothetical protein [Solirubrobacteraceae bacterium]